MQVFADQRTFVRFAHIGRRAEITSRQQHRGGSLSAGPNHHAGQDEGRPKSVRPIVEDDALLDHHIEELLGTFGDVLRMSEHGPDTERRLE